MNENARRSRHELRRRLARRVLTIFVATFLATRILVLLIMTRRLPDFFLFLGGTHIHHLNFGIILLAVAGGLLLFSGPRERESRLVAAAYAIGLALTFDEFGMWLHLGGGYWQRASFDAVIVVGGCLALLAFLPPMRYMGAKHAATAGLLLAACVAFGYLLFEAAGVAERRIGPALHRIEAAGPK